MCYLNVRQLLSSWMVAWAFLESRNGDRTYDDKLSLGKLDSTHITNEVISSSIFDTESRKLHVHSNSYDYVKNWDLCANSDFDLVMSWAVILFLYQKLSAGNRHYSSSIWSSPFHFCSCKAN